jgi:hypothetical protein
MAVNRNYRGSLNAKEETSTHTYDNCQNSNEQARKLEREE